MNQQIDETLQTENSQIAQITQALTQANILAQTVQDENIRNALIMITQSTAVLIQTLSKQFDLLFKQIIETQEKFQALDRAQQQRRSNEEEQQQHQTIYHVIASQLHITHSQLKEKIHQKLNLICDDTEEEQLISEKLDNNKVDKQILELISRIYKIKLFIYNGRTKQKQIYGKESQQQVSIYYVRNNYQVLKRRQDHTQNNRKAQSRSNERNHKKTLFQHNQDFQANPSSQSISQQIVQSIKKEVKRQVSYQKKKPQIEMQESDNDSLVSEDHYNDSQNEIHIYCEQCGSGPYKTRASYNTHIHQKHKGKTPTKNRETIMGIEINKKQFKPINEYENRKWTFKSLIIMSWNVCSIKPNTFKEIQLHKPHILCLQEVRNKAQQDTVKYKYYYDKKRQGQSGGIIVGIHKQFHSRDITKYFLDNQKENKLDEPDLLIIHIVNPIIDLIVINIYFHNQNEFISYKQKFLEMVRTILSKSGSNLKLVICGDFNTPILNYSGFRDLLNQEVTFRRQQQNRLIQSQTDHILVLQKMKCRYKKFWTNLSDHAAFKITIILDNQYTEDRLESKSEIVISKIKANQQCQKLLTNPNIKKFQDFYRIYKKLLFKKGIISKNRIRIQPVNKSRNQEDFIKNLKIQLENSKQEFFKTIRNSVIMHQQRKDGGIFNCYLDENDHIRTGEDIFTNCTSILSNLSKLGTYVPLSIPQLPELNEEEIKELQKQMASNKAISFDGITHSFVKNCHWNILKDIWNEGTFRTNPKLGWARLIPLNKVHPAIPGKEQFRPLVILSPLFKFLELRFNKRLQLYLKDGIQKQQTGFIIGLGTQVNIYLLNQWMKEIKGKDMQYLIFIDFSSAYNTIRRKTIYKILKEKEILGIQEVKFLQALHSRILYINTYDNRNKVYFKNGVPQGSPISPALFNIYMDEFLKSLFQMIDFNVNFLGYADDIVFRTSQRNIRILLQKLEEHSLKWNLRINKKKCGILPIKHNIQMDNIINYPVIDNYRYLGIEVDQKGTFKFHYKLLKTKINFIKYKLMHLMHQMNFKQRTALYYIYIEPHFLYFSVSQSFANKVMSKKFTQLRKQIFKQLTKLPKNTPEKVIGLLLVDNTQIIKKNITETIKKIRYRHLIQDESQYDLATTNIQLEFPKILNTPDNLQLLFKLAWKACNDHNKRLQYKHILSDHLFLTQDDAIESLVLGSINNKEKCQIESCLESLKFQNTISQQQQ